MAKQFVVEVFMKNSRIWVPSENTGLTWPFSTESEAQVAIDQNGSRGMAVELGYTVLRREVKRATVIPSCALDGIVP